VFQHLARLTYLCHTVSMSSIPVTPKKRGRPATGRDPQVQVRLHPSLIRQLDERAERDGISRSEIIRRLLKEALEARGMLKAE